MAMSRVSMAAAVALALALSLQVAAAWDPSAPDPDDWNSGDLAKAVSCINGNQAVQAMPSYKAYVQNNFGCQSGDCDAMLDGYVDGCDNLPDINGWSYSMCHTNLEGVDQQGTFHAWTEHTCWPKACGWHADYGTERAINLMSSGASPWKHAYGQTSCNFWEDRVIEFDAIDVGRHFLFFAAVVIFAWFERQRRWGHMESRWPNAATHGRGHMRTELFECCPWKGGFTRHFWSHCCCATAMAVFNRADLDDRQFIWQDICCERLVCTNAYWNRLWRRHGCRRRPGERLGRRRPRLRCRRRAARRGAVHDPGCRHQQRRL